MEELLQATERRGPEHSAGGGTKGSHREPLPDAPPTLADIGITKKESARAQKLAALPEAKRPILAGRRRRGKKHREQSRVTR